MHAHHCFLLSIIPHHVSLSERSVPVIASCNLFGSVRFEYCASVVKTFFGSWAMTLLKLYCLLGHFQAASTFTHSQLGSFTPALGRIYLPATFVWSYHQLPHHGHLWSMSAKPAISCSGGSFATTAVAAGASLRMAEVLPLLMGCAREASTRTNWSLMTMVVSEFYMYLTTARNI